MARGGKKKGGKQGENKEGDNVSGMSSLSLTSEGGPSTSQTGPPADQPSEPPSKESTPAKPSKESTPAEPSKESTPAEPSKESTPAPEEGDSGLFGGDGEQKKKRIRPKKNKSSQGTAIQQQGDASAGCGRGAGRGQPQQPRQPLPPGQTQHQFPGQVLPGPPQGFAGPLQGQPQFPGQPQPPAGYAPGYPGPSPQFPGHGHSGFPVQGPPAVYPVQPQPGPLGPFTPGPPAVYPPGHPGSGIQFPGQVLPGLQQGFAGPSQGHPQFPGQPQPPAGYAPGYPGPGIQFPGQGHPGQAMPRPQIPGPAQPGFPGQPQQAPKSQPQQQAQAAPAQKPSQPAQQAQTSQPPSKASSPPHDATKCRFAIPRKIPGGKVQARPQMLLTNYLEMKIKPNMKIYRYDVGFTPDRPKKAIPKAFSIAMKRHFPNIMVAFDQMKNFYSVDPLPKVTTTDRLTDSVEVVDDNGKIMKFEVSFKATGVIELNALTQYMKSGGTSLNPPTEAIQCVDVILRQGTLESYIKAGRTFFKRPSRPVVLGDGLEMWTGLFQSAIFTSRPFVNIDVAHKGFPIQQPLVALIDSLRLDPRRDLLEQRGRGIETFNQFIKGLRVVAVVGGDTSTRGQKREFICNGLAKPPGEIMFMCKDASGRERKMSVYDYFTLEKRCRLQYPKLNCMWVGPRDKNIFYPIELLDIAYGQVRNRQLNENQLRTMVMEAATPPNIRKQKIEEVIRDMNYPRNPHFKKFGLEISDKFSSIEGRVMPPPRLQCGGNFSAEPRKGAWNADQLLQGAQLSLWGLVGVGVDAGACKAENIISMFQSVGRQMGMSVAPPVMRQFNLRPPELQKLMEAAIDKKLQMLVVVVNSAMRDCYSQVKKVAELNVGLLTQCIKDKTAAMRMNPQTVRNILLKVNSKLMGVNHAIDSRFLPPCLKEPFMMVGADVTHPSPDQSNIPSIAAVTASIDKRGFKYNLEFSIQAPKMEMIVQFEDMMVDHLNVFRKQLNTLPKKIYVFRDGVSEGQFAQVMNSELQAVYSAFARVSGAQERPKVLFLLVQKRHHTRFFLDKSSNNVEPGTVVDKDIVHPSELDFYLVSHQAIKGTARPTRYHAVCNDQAMPADEVEQLAFYLCHLYSRCTRSVSYPAPTYYAHLACLRARALTFNNTYDNAKLEKQPIRLNIKAEVKDNNPMFFV